MSPALWLLLRLHLRGWLRHLGRGLTTVRGVLMLLVGLAVFLPWMGMVLVGAGEGNVDRSRITGYGPALLVLYCVLNVVFSPNERTVYFSPAEVQFLFAGPFTRREILVYKILLTLMVSVPLTLIMGAVVRVRDGWVPAVLLGLLMISIFMQLFTLALGLLASAAGAGMYSRGRKLAAAIGATLAALVVVEAGRQADWQWRQLFTQAETTTAWKVASYPMQAFFDLMVTRQLPDLVLPLAICLGVNLALVALVLLLDHGYQEAAAAGSARRYAALQRVRGRSVGAEAPAAQSKVRWTLPSLPFLEGIGVIAWRQSISAFRALGRLMLALVIVATVVAVLLAGMVGDEPSPMHQLGAVFGMLAWVSIFITNLVPFDFRGDVDRIALLKTLPIVPWRLTLGQLLAPTLLLSMGQWLALATMMAAWPDQWPAALASAACVPLYNFVLVGLDNLLFLLFPVRMHAATPGDFQALGRNVVLSMGKLVGLGVVLGTAVVPAVVVYSLTESPAWAVLTACPVLLAGCVVLVPLVSLAYQRFDVSRDTPA